MCQFQGASENDRDESFWGKPFVDIGGGKVAQSRTREGPCVREEGLVFVDCNQPDAIFISGKRMPEEIAGFTWYSIKAAQLSGGGPIALRATSTVEGLRAVAHRHRIGYRLGVEDNAGQGQNRVDPLCGCKVFYPASPGANRAR